MSKQIFLVYTRNRCIQQPILLMMATTSARKVKMYISKLIEDEAAEYDFGHGTEFTAKRQAKEFRKDFGKKTIEDLNNGLWYVFFDYVYDGEET